MEIGVIADTHDNVPAVEDAVDLFDDNDIEVVLHCGDVIAPLVVPFFEGLEVHAVLGNNDGERAGLEAAFEDLGLGSQLHGRLAELRIVGKEIAMLHGEDRSVVESRAEKGAYDFVFFGHHHERELVEINGTTVVNPGAHFPTVPAEHRTIALVDLETETVTFERI